MLNHKTLILSFVAVLFLFNGISLSANDTGLFYRINSLTEINTGDTIIIVGEDSVHSGILSFLPYVRSVLDEKNEKRDFRYTKYTGETDYCISPDSNNVWIVTVAEINVTDKHIQLCHPYVQYKQWLTNNRSGYIHTGAFGVDSNKESSHFIIKEFDGDFYITRKLNTSSYLRFEGDYWLLSTAKSMVNRRMIIYKHANGLTLKKENSTLIFSGTFNEDAIRRIDNKSITNIDFRNVTDAIQYSPANPNCIVYYPMTQKGYIETGNAPSNGNVSLLNIADENDFSPEEPIYADEVNYTRAVFLDGGYETICLPFVPSIIKDTDDNDITTHFTFEEFIGQKSSDVLSFDTIDISDFQAGKAYLMSNTIPYDDQKKTVVFVGYNQDIVNTPTDDTFIGYFRSVTKGGNELFTLNSAGQYFCPFLSDLTKQFRAYIIPTTDMQCKKYSVTHDDILSVYSTSINDVVDVYDLNGMLIHKNIHKNNLRETLKNGTYIINNRKYIIR